MSTMIRKTRGAAAALLTLAVFATTAAAQQIRTQNAPPSGEGVVAQAKSTSADWIAAARALEASAALRPAGDTLGIQERLAAATAYRIGGRVAAARKLALATANDALRADNREGASRAFLAAASYSAELRDEDATQYYVYRSRMLADILTRDPLLLAQSGKGNICQPRTSN